MSTSYNAYVIYGIKLPFGSLKTRRPHPLWKIHKFDPETGEKVSQFIEKQVYGEDIIDSIPERNHCKSNVVVHSNQCENTAYFGRVLAECGEYARSFHTPWSCVINDDLLGERDKEIVREDVVAGFKKHLPDLKITPDMFKKYLVLVIS